MDICGDNQFYIEGLNHLFRKCHHLSDTFPEGARIYVLSGMSLSRIHKLLTRLPPPYLSVFILNPRHYQVFSLMLPEQVKLLLPETIRPEILLRELTYIQQLRQNNMPKSVPHLTYSFSSTEMKVIRLMVDGKSLAETSALLGISPKACSAHRVRVFRKVGTRSMQEFYSLWRNIKNHLMPPEISAYK